MTPRLREAEKYVVCGPCELRIPASLIVCPSCKSGTERNNNDLCHLTYEPELVEVVQSRPQSRPPNRTRTRTQTRT